MPWYHKRIALTRPSGQATQSAKELQIDRRLDALAAFSDMMVDALGSVPEYGNAACTATITATRDGKTVGTLEVKTALHAAYLWPKEVMSK